MLSTTYAWWAEIDVEVDVATDFTDVGFLVTLYDEEIKDNQGGQAGKTSEREKEDS